MGATDVVEEIDFPTLSAGRILHIFEVGMFRQTVIAWAAIAKISVRTNSYFNLRSSFRLDTRSSSECPNGTPGREPECLLQPGRIEFLVYFTILNLSSVDRLLALVIFITLGGISLANASCRVRLWRRMSRLKSSSRCSITITECHKSNSVRKGGNPQRRKLQQRRFLTRRWPWGSQ